MVVNIQDLKSPWDRIDSDTNFLMRSRAHWGDVVDGLFSWESSWPLHAGFGGQFPGDVSPDVKVMNGVIAHNKSYMIGGSLTIDAFGVLS